jgi:tripartite-type tricarboxylate transporter receptor subunit TctC
MNRRELIKISLGAVALPATFSGAHAQQAYPSRPITIIVPFTPGGSTDILGRLLGQQFQDSMKQPVTLENRPGAGGGIGSSAVARAEPNGYTLGIGHIGTLAVNPSLYPNLSYDPIKSFAHLGMLAKVHNILVVNPSVPAKDVKEFIAYAKQNPGKLKYGSGGIGSAAHIATEALALETDTRFVHVPYKGTGPAVVDLLSGQIDMMVTGAPAVLQYVENGKLRALGTASLTRLPSAPNIPTISEAGVKDFEAVQWYGVIAPAGTPDAIVTKLNGEIGKALKDPKIIQALEKDGAEPWPLSPDEFRAYILKEIPFWKKVVDGAKITVEQ